MRDTGEITVSDLIDQAQYWLNWLGIAERQNVTLEEVVKNISLKKGKEIDFETGEIPPRFGIGMTTIEAGRYLIGLDEKVTEPLLLTGKCHELVHIMFGDVEKGVVRRITSWSEQGDGERVKCHIELHIDPTNEKIVEYVAECIAEKVRTLEAQVGNDLFLWLD